MSLQLPPSNVYLNPSPPTLTHQFCAYCAGLCILYSSSTVLHWHEVQVLPFIGRMLVWKSGLTFEGARAKGRRGIVECDCAMMETLWDFCPGKTESWWPSTAQIGTKMLYLPKPRPRVWIVPVSSLLGRLPLIPAGDTGTVPHSMHGVMPASYPGGVCDTVDQPGTGSALFYINSWAMVFPSDHPAD